MKAFAIGVLVFVLGMAAGLQYAVTHTGVVVQPTVSVVEPKKVANFEEFECVTAIEIEKIAVRLPWGASLTSPMTSEKVPNEVLEARP